MTETTVTPTFHQEVEEHFLKARGKGSQLSPLDYPLIEEWFRTDVPLELVKRVIDKGFASNPSIGSIKYFKDRVAEEMKRRAELHAGGRPPAPAAPVAIQEPDYKEQVIAHLQRCASQIESLWNVYAPKEDDSYSLLNQAFANNGLALLAMIDHLKQDTAPNFESYERQLDLLEDSIFHAVIFTLQTTGEMTAIQKQCEAKLTTHKNRMNPDAYRETLERSIRKESFSQLGIPRLSLFYMTER